MVVMAAAAMAEVKVVSLVAEQEVVQVVGEVREEVAKVVMVAPMVVAPMVETAAAVQPLGTQGQAAAPSSLRRATGYSLSPWQRTVAQRHSSPRRQPSCYRQRWRRVWAERSHDHLSTANRLG